MSPYFSSRILPGNCIIVESNLSSQRAILVIIRRKGMKLVIRDTKVGSLFKAFIN